MGDRPSTAVKNSHALIHATLIVMGTLVLTFPAVHDLIISSQNSYLLAQNPSPSRYPAQAMSGGAQGLFFLIGLGMIFLGGRPALSRSAKGE